MELDFSHASEVLRNPDRPLGPQSRIRDGRRGFSQEVGYYKGPRFSHPALTPELGSRLGGETFHTGQKSCNIGAPPTYSLAGVRQAEGKTVTEVSHHEGASHPQPFSRAEFRDGDPGQEPT